MLNTIKNKALFFNVFSILFLFNFMFADPTDGCELPENTIFLTDSGDVLYNIPTDFAGAQFDVDGGATVDGVSGGEAAGADSRASASNNCCLSRGSNSLSLSICSPDHGFPVCVGGPPA